MDRKTDDIARKRKLLGLLEQRRTDLTQLMRSQVGDVITWNGLNREGSWRQLKLSLKPSSCLERQRNAFEELLAPIGVLNSASVASVGRFEEGSLLCASVCVCVGVGCVGLCGCVCVCIKRFAMFFCRNRVLAQIGAERCIYIYIWCSVCGVVWCGVVWCGQVPRPHALKKLSYNPTRPPMSYVTLSASVCKYLRDVSARTQI